jgi:hypothetical protein
MEQPFLSRYPACTLGANSPLLLARVVLVKGGLIPLVSAGRRISVGILQITAGRVGGCAPHMSIWRHRTWLVTHMGHVPCLTHALFVSPSRRTRPNFSLTRALAGTFFSASSAGVRVCSCRRRFPYQVGVSRTSSRPSEAIQCHRVGERARRYALEVSPATSSSVKDK